MRPDTNTTDACLNHAVHAVNLKDQAAMIAERCTSCSLCRQHCAFLQRYGLPETIARNILAPNGDLLSSYECSLCGLCGAVCPENLKPDSLFLEMRRSAAASGQGPLKAHTPLMAYEKKGTSKLFSFYSLPAGCTAVFFPGCTLTGTRPEATLAAYGHLKMKDPSTGIVLDCCCKPSHDLGRQDHFMAMLDEMAGYLQKNGVKTIIAGCPNCFRVFRDYLNGFDILTLFECIALNESVESSSIPFTVHDPCVLRSEPQIHEAVRKLAESSGCTLTEMNHSGKNTFCCGEGAGAGFVNPDMGLSWKTKRLSEAGGHPVITYCAGCANTLKSHGAVSHILDVVFDTEAVMKGRLKASSAPFTYLNRLSVKRRIKKDHPAAVTRERMFRPDDTKEAAGLFKLVAVMALILDVVFGFRHFGLSAFFQKDALKAWVEHWGVFAPLVYILIYSIAPALFLPGLPITLVGGVLFGPFWGVVYTITGATIGAIVPFLISRYAARDWAERLMTHPGLKRLDEDVGRKGWKIVAVTRLIPIFPYNLLNYAFGLTRIGFVPYVTATFVCMLPACIAFIVFSSSLPDMIRGHVSPAFLAGAGLIAVVSCVPIVLRKVRNKS